MSKPQTLIPSPPDLLFLRLPPLSKWQPLFTSCSARTLGVILDASPSLGPSLTPTGNSANTLLPESVERTLRRSLAAQLVPAPSPLARVLPALSPARPSPQAFPTRWPERPFLSGSLIAFVLGPDPPVTPPLDTV